MSPLQLFRAKITDRSIYNAKFQFVHCELLEPTARMEFAAGQYVLLSVPGEGQKKSFSIVNPPEVDHAVDLLLDVTPQGPATLLLTQSPLGTEIEFMAPVGQFVVADRASEAGAEEDELVFIATGSGIAPIKGMLEDLLVTKGDQRPMTLYWGLRNQEDTFWYDEFSLLSQSHPNFTFSPVLSQPPEGWEFSRGHVTDCLAAHTYSAPQRVGYYICGSKEMVTDVAALLAERGVDPKHIHHEKFY